MKTTDDNYVQILINVCTHVCIILYYKTVTYNNIIINNLTTII